MSSNSNKPALTETATEISSQAWSYPRNPVNFSRTASTSQWATPELAKVRTILRCTLSATQTPFRKVTGRSPDLRSNSVEHGPYVLRLTAKDHTETFVRSGFLMHGDSKSAPRTASHGFVIMPRRQRAGLEQRRSRSASGPRDSGCTPGREVKAPINTGEVVGA